MNGVVALLTIVDRFGRDAVDTRQFDVSTLQLTIRCQVSGSQDIRLVLLLTPRGGSADGLQLDFHYTTY